MDPGWKSPRHVACPCKYHVVWCPKYRRKVLLDDIAVRLKRIVVQVAQETGSEVLEIEMLPGHVHLLCEVDPRFGIARFVRPAKGRTSHHLRQEFATLRSRLPALWANNWFVATARGAPPALIERHLASQKNR